MVIVGEKQRTSATASSKACEYVSGWSSTLWRWLCTWQGSMRGRSAEAFSEALQRRKRVGARERQIETDRDRERQRETERDR